MMRLVVFLLMALLPFRNMIKFSFLSIGVNIADAILILLLILLTIKGNLIIAYSKRYLWYYGVLLFYLLSLVLFGDNLVSGFYLYYNYLLIPLLYYLVFSSLNITRLFKPMLYGLFTGVSIFSVFVYEALSQNDFLRSTVLGTSYIDVSLIGLMLVYFTLALDLGKWKKRAFLGLGFLVMVSQMPRFFLLAVVIFPFLFTEKRLSKAHQYFAAVTLVSAVVLFITVELTDFGEGSNRELTVEQHNSLTRFSDREVLLQNVLVRVASFDQDIERFKQNVIYGAGLKKGEHHITPHNYVIEWLLYGGIIGFGLFFLLFYESFQYGSSKIDRFSKYLLLLSLIVVFNGLFNGVLHGLAPTAIWMTFGILHSYQKSANFLVREDVEHVSTAVAR